MADFGIKASKKEGELEENALETLAALDLRTITKMARDLSNVPHNPPAIGVYAPRRFSTNDFPHYNTFFTGIADETSLVDTVLMVLLLLIPFFLFLEIDREARKEGSQLDGHDE